MGARQRFAIPDGWIARGFRFEVEPTSPEQPQRIARSFGGRRFAYNWALEQVKASLDARTTDPSVSLLPWSFYELRRAWNQAKHEVAPWWPTCSKEAYACGLADLVAALHTWADAKAGRRSGGQVGFPRFKSRHRDRGRVRFTTGAMRLEPDRRHLVLPVLGRLRAKENTRRLERLIGKGRARVLSMTLSEQGGRLYVSVQAIVARTPRTPVEPQGRCGIDLGIGNQWAVIAHHDGTIERVAHPAPWAAVHKQRRRVARQRSRRIVGSRGHRHASAKLARLDRRAANLRTNQLHILTTTLVRRYGTVVSKTWMSVRWAGGWAAARFAVPSIKPGSAGSAPPWPTSVRRPVGGWWSLTAGMRRPKSTMVAAGAIGPICSLVSGCGCAPDAGSGWTATPTRR